jgi:hypothetical protein
VPIGRAVAGTRLYVLDAHGEPVPRGVLGELCVGGDGLARGYVGSAAMTAERFVPDPFGAEPGGRLYRTGDRARWNAAGDLEFAGRADEQVKIRGFRVEPAEVEAVLRAHPSLDDAAVLPQEAGATGRRLVGYVAPRPGAAVDAAALRDYLAGFLPAYMIPAPIVVLPALPLTPNGKLDRRALSATRPPAPPPRELSAEEALVAEVWADLLKIGVPGPDVDFFSLGGHSLLALRAAARVGAELGVELPVAALFQFPTVRALTAQALTLREERLAERLAWIESLTEEEAQALLAEPAR